MRFANLGVAFAAKLRYIARCRFSAEKMPYVTKKERREENTNLVSI